MTGPDKGKPGKTKPLTGGVQHDARGNAVWQWATETARHAVASTSQLLRRLDVSSLKLEELDEEKAAAKAAGKPGGTAPGKPAVPARKSHGGFNPYDGAAIARAPMAKKPDPKNTPATVPVRKRTSWWRRLFQRR